MSNPRILSGYNKAIITGAELRFAKRGDQIQQFSFLGNFRQPADILQSHQWRCLSPT